MKRPAPVAALLAACLLASPALAVATPSPAGAPSASWTEAVDLDLPVTLAAREAGPASSTGVGIAAAPTFIQVAGPSRVSTAVEASKRAFPASGVATAAVLCTGWDFPDALGGAALAGALGGPLLLTTPSGLPNVVSSELVRLDVREVVIVGSESAVTPAVESSLTAMSFNGHGMHVTRIGGHDRFETAALVASATVEAMRARGRAYDGTAFFATGYNFPDALCASAVSAKKGWPILLVAPGGLPTATADAVAGLGVKRGIMLGSEKTVTPAVAAQLDATLPAAPERLAGIDRYRTGVEIARFSVANGLGWNGVAIATGLNFPDALAGGVMQARLGSVVLITNPVWLSPCVRDELAARKSVITTVRYLGNTNSLPQRLRDEVSTALGYPPVHYNGMTFPVAGQCSFRDTFGAPRSGNRTHQGCDIMAAGGTPCVAILSGTVSTKEGGLGGKVTYLDADNGWRFYYAHLSGWAVRSGRISQGQKIAYVGNTGNAAGGPTHLHLQMWKPNGTLVNPYPYLLQMKR